MATVLYIEDDPASRLLVRKLLVAAGHEVLEAADGLEGVRLACQYAVDLVLVDIDVPGLDGYEVILRLRGIEPLRSVPIVALTAQADRAETLAVGADGFVSKPIDVRSFPDTVARFLGGHREVRPEASEEKLRERSARIVERLERRVEELTRARARLEEMERLRSEYLRNVSHELATPMTPVVGYLRLLLDEDLGPLTDEQRRCLQVVERSVHRLRRVVDSLVDVAAFERGTLRFSVADYDVRELFRSVAAEGRALAERNGVTFRFQEPEGALAARGDVDRLRRAVLHLVDNAIKFVAKGGTVALEGRVAPDGTVEALVADDGPGVDEAQRERLFEPFFQVDGSRTRRHGGVGLGLALVRRVARAHGGDTDIVSPPDRPVAGVQPGGTLVRMWFGTRPAWDAPESGR